MTGDLYEQVVLITEEYLGPAAQRFVDRHITYHIGKAPQAINGDDLPILIEWTQITLGLLTEDRRIIDDYTHKMKMLAKQAHLWQRT